MWVKLSIYGVVKFVKYFGKIFFGAGKAPAALGQQSGGPARAFGEGVDVTRVRPELGENLLQFAKSLRIA